MRLKELHCPTALLPDGWARDVVIKFDEAGWIRSVRTEVMSWPAVSAAGPVLPGMPNVHSHAFQRALAGLTQVAGPGDDDFWSWRQMMYAFAGRMTPEAVEATAEQLYVTMLKSGYTAVGEFHYLHHQPDGTPYADRAELSRRILVAARRVGIGLTHLPVLYAYGGFGAQPPSDEQRRFLNDVDGLGRILEAVAADCAQDPQLRLGLAPHSLRAVTEAMLHEALALLDRLDPSAPVHIHVAEQMREVMDCLVWSGQRPVAWLLDHMPVSERWCLVHATHMMPEETAALAASGAVAGLCPTTEADLGDGLFPVVDYLRQQGRFGIGSDSHTLVSPADELRMLEYGQRLSRQRRNVLRHADHPSIGRGLYTAALDGGARALGRPIGRIAPGYRADLVVLNAEDPLLFGKSDDAILDTYLFSGGPALVHDVIVGGRHLVQAGHHPDEEAIAARYRRTMERLLRQVV
ncbi:formimidoylglutamate deiminase [Rhodocaloribacter litoris]|uniref:formimidoylglutamate deiminase n=1 Tax=Rhodocaloribacter litoris TaxID=2558931 RepID=UPI00142102D2|nr:formimidoylglutamate deiminase [Rhodocaloribacter litoris]QXD16360.1 formimidoylglutamate deiminase [Rhodocaloribacter litoris]